MSLDNELWLAGVLLEAGVLGLLIYRRVWRLLPFFCLFIAWSLVSEGLSYLVERRFAGLTSVGYLHTYLAVMAIDSALQFCVMVEIAWSILRPLRASLSYRALLLVALVILVAGSAIWPFASVHGLGRYSAAWRGLVHLQQTASILRIVVFLFMAGCSQLLSIGWRDRELQIATGLGFYSLVSLTVDILQQHREMGPIYNSLERIAVVSYCCSLLYWGFSFSRQEAARREFTPQMQSFLLAVAGTARSARIDLTDSRAGRRRDDRD